MIVAVAPILFGGSAASCQLAVFPAVAFIAVGGTIYVLRCWALPSLCSLVDTAAVAPRSWLLARFWRWFWWSVLFEPLAEPSGPHDWSARNSSHEFGGFATSIIMDG
jgi:hypothetical protein